MTDSGEIVIFGVYDRGIPNQERIVLKVAANVRLSNYFLILGVSAKETPNNIWPLNDNFFWLPDLHMSVDGWVVVYTGKGSPSISQEINTLQPMHILYWNKPTVLFDKADMYPALSSFGGILIGNKPNRYLPEAPPPPSAPNVSIEEPWQKLLEAFTANLNSRNKLTDNTK